MENFMNCGEVDEPKARFSTYTYFLISFSLANRSLERVCTWGSNFCPLESRARKESPTCERTLRCSDSWYTRMGTSVPQVGTNSLAFFYPIYILRYTLMVRATFRKLIYEERKILAFAFRVRIGGVNVLIIIIAFVCVRDKSVRWYAQRKCVRIAMRKYYSTRTKNKR